MDEKEEYIFNQLKYKIENYLFDEIDIMTFLILIRRLLKEKYDSILEFADLIAHRERSRGLIMEAIKKAIENNYSYDTTRKKIIGYSGIESKKWTSEFERLGKEFGIVLNDRIIREITLCIYSLVNQTVYKTGKFIGVTKLELIPRIGQIAIVTTENKNTSLYICFAEYKGYNINDNCDECINYDFVYTKRINKKLVLMNKKNEILVTC